MNSTGLRDRTFYLNKAHALCNAFSQGAPPAELASFFHADDGVAYEHGPKDIPELPFLGRPYEGRQAIEEYFNMLIKYLKVVDEMVFSDWTVDLDSEVNSSSTSAASHGAPEGKKATQAVITTRGRTSFEYISTSKRQVLALIKPNRVLGVSGAPWTHL